MGALGGGVLLPFVGRRSVMLFKGLLLIQRWYWKPIAVDCRVKTD